MRYKAILSIYLPQEGIKNESNILPIRLISSSFSYAITISPISIQMARWQIWFNLSKPTPSYRCRNYVSLISPDMRGGGSQERISWNRNGTCGYLAFLWYLNIISKHISLNAHHMIDNVFKRFIEQETDMTLYP